MIDEDHEEKKEVLTRLSIAEKLDIKWVKWSES